MNKLQIIVTDRSPNYCAFAGLLKAASSGVLSIPTVRIALFSYETNCAPKSRTYNSPAIKKPGDLKVLKCCDTIVDSGICTFMFLTISHPRYRSVFHDAVKEESKAHKTSSKTMGLAKVSVNDTTDFMKKRSKEPQMPDGK